MATPSPTSNPSYDPWTPTAGPLATGVSTAGSLVNPVVPSTTPTSSTVVTSQAGQNVMNAAQNTMTNAQDAMTSQQNFLTQYAGNQQTVNQQGQLVGALNDAKKALSTPPAPLPTDEEHQRSAWELNHPGQPYPGGSGGSSGGDSNLDRIQRDLDARSAEFQAIADQYGRGTLPLTAAQQAQVASLRQQFDSLLEEQRRTNANYLGGVTQLGINTGQNRYAADLALGSIQQATSEGLKKVQEIEARAVQAITAMEEGFRDKNYARVKEAYDVYSTAVKDKQKVIQDANDRATAAAKDLRDFNAKQKQNEFENTLKLSDMSLKEKQTAIDEWYKQGMLTQAQKRDAQDYSIKLAQLNQGNYELTTDSFGQPVAFDKKTGKMNYSVIPQMPASLSGATNAAYTDALNNALVGLSEAQRAETRKQVQAQIAAGDMQRAKETIVRISMKSAGVDQFNQALARLTAIDNLNGIRTALNAYVSATGDTNILKGTLEQAAQKIGLTSDPNLAKISTTIQSFIQQYRRSMTGVAFGDKESTEYKKIMPSIDNVNKLNSTKIDALVDLFNNNQRTFVGASIGQTNYDQIFGRGGSQTVVNAAPKIREAISQGHKPQEIIDFLKADPVLGGKIQAAIQAGHKPEEIIQYLQQ